MQIPFETFVTIGLAAGMGLVFGHLVVNHQIIRHVCRREGRGYPFLWPWSSYWLWRTFKPAWFEDAREAGYFRELIALHVAGAILVAGIIFLQVGGFVYHTPSLRPP